MPRKAANPKQPVAKSPLTERFAKNLGAAMAHAGKSQNDFKPIGQRSIGRLLKSEQSPTLEMVHAIAQKLDLDGWQLLVPEFDPKNPAITKAIDARQRAVFKAIEENMKNLKR